MIPVHTTEQIRRAEAAAYESLPPGRLMERAAEALAAEVARHARGGGHVLVVAGPGDNGGDGLWAGARLAADRDVRVWRPFDRVHEAGWAGLLRAGGREVDADEALSGLPDAAVVVDAVLGMGPRPGLPDHVARFAAACREVGVPVVSCDVPSGLDSDGCGSGGPAFEPTRTVTMGAWKACLLLQPGRSRCGEVTLVDIGLELPPPALVVWERADLAAAWPWPHATSDKYSRGVVGLDTGSDTYPGAGVLSAYGAVHAGAGMVRAAGSPTVADLLVRELPNVVHAEGRVQAWVVGSGWGERPDGARRLADLLAQQVPMVVDADALGLVRGLPLRPDVLLTPHAGELARLLGTERAQVQADPVAAVRRAAAELGATVLLKGASQYVATPDDPQVRVALPGPPWTAQAGSGDVLAGVCGALLAAGLPAPVAALAGASVQALAATEHPGPYPPQEMARRLPGVIAGLAG